MHIYIYTYLYLYIYSFVQNHTHTTKRANGFAILELPRYFAYRAGETPHPNISQASPALGQPTFARWSWDLDTADFPPFLQAYV